MKIAVYTICKNEAAQISGWLENTREFDGRFVVDTGSTDESVERLKMRGVTVATMGMERFRYDRARQAALTLISKEYDIAVVLDFDERFREGWRDTLEAIWKPGETQQVVYTFIHSWNEDGSPQNVFPRDLIHTPADFFWKHACHEALYPCGPLKAPALVAMDIVCEHHQDKNKPREGRIELLELDAIENPSSHRSLFHLGREYWIHKRLNDAASVFTAYLRLKNAPAAEKSTVQRFVAKIMSNTGHQQAALQFFRMACDTFPVQREPWVDLAEFCFAIGEYLEGYHAITKALQITERAPLSTGEIRCWGHLPMVLKKSLAHKLGRTA